MSKTKAQMEILGLALIVLLIGLGLLFALQYSLKKPASQTQKIKESILAANFLSSMLKTTTDCHNRQIKELLQDCALTRTIDCPGKSCDVAHDIIKTLLQKTLKTWKKNYDFHIDGAEAIQPLHFSSVMAPPACKTEKESKTHILTVTAGFDLTLTLDIC